MRQAWRGTTLYLISPTPIADGAEPPPGQVTAEFNCGAKIGTKNYATMFSGLQPDVESALQLLRVAVRAAPASIAYVMANMRLLGAEVENDAYRQAAATQASAADFFSLQAKKKLPGK